MDTKVEKITPESIRRAKELLLGGSVVAIPTETVYGLGGNAFLDGAVKEIFAVKGRPADNPLIAHVHKDYPLEKIVDFEPPYAKKLKEKFCPGPLTLVYPSKDKVSKFVSCGLSTLAVRIPAHEGAQALLKEVDIPIVAPSANLSKHVSPTSAQHVYDDFCGKIPLILDGGQSVGGIESTVCDVTGDVPVILRPGLITREMIASVCGDCLVHEPNLEKGERAKSPGMLYKHYAPKCETRLFSLSDLAKAKAFYQEKKVSGKRVCFLCEEELFNGLKEEFCCLNLGATASQMASNLYRLLREAEALCDVLIAIEPEEKTGIMEGVLNRLYKACKSEDIAH